MSLAELDRALARLACATMLACRCPHCALVVIVESHIGILVCPHCAQLALEHDWRRVRVTVEAGAPPEVH